MRSHPPQDALAPGVDQAQKQHEDENAHFDETETCVSLQLRSPREDEHSFNIKNHEKQRENVITDLALRPAFTDRIDTTFVRQLLFPRWLYWPKQRSDPQQETGN